MLALVEILALLAIPIAAVLLVVAGIRSSRAGR